MLTPEAFAEGTQAVQTLKQEIRLARKITHPNVVRTHDLGEADGLRFLTMEYVPGTTLRELLDRTGRGRPRARPPDRQAALPRPRGHPRGGDHPPRHQAAEHHGPAERRREGDGLRHRADGGGGRPPLPRRRDRRDAVLHEPRAGDGARPWTRGATSTPSASSCSSSSPGSARSSGTEPAEVMQQARLRRAAAADLVAPRPSRLPREAHPRLPRQAPRPEARERRRPLRGADAGRRVGRQVRRALSAPAGARRVEGRLPPSGPCGAAPAARRAGPPARRSAPSGSRRPPSSAPPRVCPWPPAPPSA